MQPFQCWIRLLFSPTSKLKSGKADSSSFYFPQKLSRIRQSSFLLPVKFTTVFYENVASDFSKHFTLKASGAERHHFCASHDKLIKYAKESTHCNIHLVPLLCYTTNAASKDLLFSGRLYIGVIRVWLRRWMEMQWVPFQWLFSVKGFLRVSKITFRETWQNWHWQYQMVVRSQKFSNISLLETTEKTWAWKNRKLDVCSRVYLIF